MTKDIFLTKGDRVRAVLLVANPHASLAGVQMKFDCHDVEVVGACRHFRGNDPVNPTEVLIYVEPEGDLPYYVPRVRPPGCTCTDHGDLVQLRPQDILEVLSRS